MSPLDPSNPVTPPRSPRPAADGAERAPADATVVAVSSVPPVLTAAPSPGGLWYALGRRWLLALTLALLGAGLVGAALWELVPAPYSSQVKVHLQKPPPYMPGADGVTFDDYLRTQAVLIRSPRLLQAVLANGQVKELASVPQDSAEAEEWLAKGIRMKLAVGENYLPLKFSGPDPHEAAIILKVLVEEYRNELRRIRKDQLQRLERALTQNGKDRKDLAIPASYDPKALEEGRLNLRKAKGELRQAQAVLGAREEAEPELTEQEIADAVADALKADMEYSALKKQRDAKVEEMRGIVQTSRMGNNDPMLTPLREEVARLDRAQTAMRRDTAAMLKPRLLRLAKKAKEERLVSLRDRVAELNEKVKERTSEVARLELLEAPDFQSKVVKDLALKEESRQLLTDINRIRRDRDELPWVLTGGEPSVPTAPDREKQLRTAGLGGFGVFVVLLFGVALVEFRSRRVTSADEVSQGLGIPTVGTIPLLPARARLAALGTGNVRDGQWQGQLTEAVDAVRTFLMRTLGDGPHVVLVTSAMPGEGKTSLASQLAASLARAWRKTLLIDGDLRKPAAHRLFDLPVEPGLSEVLRGELELADVIRPTTVGRLWLMPAGQWDPHALQALAQEGVGSLVEQLREEYEFIIVDSCPVLPVTDTLMLGQHVDTVLFSVLRGTSRLPTLYAAWQRLAALEIPVLGAVVAGGGTSLGGLDFQYPRPAAK